METRAHSPEAEVSRAMDAVLEAERAVDEAIRLATAAAEQQRREAAEVAQRILERAERRSVAIRQRIALLLQEEIARLHVEARLAADSYPHSSPSPDDLDRLARDTAAWLSTHEDQ